MTQTKFDTTGLVLESSSLPFHVSSSSGPQHTLRPAVVDEDAPLEQDYVKWAPSIVSLLSIIAPTLRYLALVMDCLQVTTLVPVALPSLAELTCMKFFWETNAIMNAPYRPQNQIYLDQKLSVLRHLHLVNTNHSPCFYASSKIPPALTQLRLTGELSMRLEQSLAWLRNPAPGHPTPELWPPRRLEVILLSPHPHEDMRTHLRFPTLFEEVNPMRWWRAAQSGTSTGWTGCRINLDAGSLENPWRSLHSLADMGRSDQSQWQLLFLSSCDATEAPIGSENSPFPVSRIIYALLSVAPVVQGTCSTSLDESCIPPKQDRD
jgi:hypothetical protein